MTTKQQEFKATKSVPTVEVPAPVRSPRARKQKITEPILKVDPPSPTYKKHKLSAAARKWLLTPAKSEVQESLFGGLTSTIPTAGSAANCVYQQYASAHLTKAQSNGLARSRSLKLEAQKNAIRTAAFRK